MEDSQLAQVQNAIKNNPTLGELIKPNICGLRKLRVADGTKGKRGGFRVIYYWLVSDTITILLDIYRKSEKTDLTKKEMAELCSILNDITDGNTTLSRPKKER